MGDAIAWLVVAEVVGLAALPFSGAAFPAMRDAGWGVAKPLGLVAVAAFVWLFSQITPMSNAAWSWWLGVGILGGTGWTLRLIHGGQWRYRERLRQGLPAILASEAVFLLFFAAWTAYRAYDPAIAGTEKPMDLMILNASFVAPTAPPQDAWLSGSPVAYYYFGYWIFAGVAKLSGVAPTVAFSLSLSLIAGLAGGAALSLVHTLVKSRGGSNYGGIVAGAAAVALMLICSNLMGWWELLAHFRVGGNAFFNWLGVQDLQPGADSNGWRPTQFWWWWRSTRVINTFNETGAGIDYTITEFPFFSFLLGDLHPHVMSIPFVLTGLAAAHSLLVSPPRWGISWLRYNPAPAAALVLLVGAAGFINAWDILFLVAFLWFAAFFKVHTGGTIFRSARAATVPLVIVIAAGLALFSPYYFGTFDSQVQWPPVAPSLAGTRLIHFFTIWGLLATVVAPVLAGATAGHAAGYFRAARWLWTGAMPLGRPRWAPVLAIGTLLVAAYLVWGATLLEFRPESEPADVALRLVTALPLGALIVVLFTSGVARAEAGKYNSTQFVLVAALLSAGLLFGAELFFVHDLFGNRMNTVFKFYYQTWVILSVVAGYGLWWWVTRHAGFGGRWIILSRATAVLASVLAIGTLYYPIAASFSKADDFRNAATLDGLAFVRNTSPDEAAAIEWLGAHAVPGETMVEAPGGSYTEYARVSGSTGVPTVIGWVGHERQWRSDRERFGDRESDVQRLYTTDDLVTARRITTLYGIDYILVGPREREKYPDLEEGKLGELGPAVFRSGSVVIYKVDEVRSVD